MVSWEEQLIRLERGRAVERNIAELLRVPRDNMGTFICDMLAANGIVITDSIRALLDKINRANGVRRQMVIKKHCDAIIEELQRSRIADSGFDDDEMDLRLLARTGRIEQIVEQFPDHSHGIDRQLLIRLLADAICGEIPVGSYNTLMSYKLDTDIHPTVMLAIAANIAFSEERDVSTNGIITAMRFAIDHSDDPHYSGPPVPAEINRQVIDTMMKLIRRRDSDELRTMLQNRGPWPTDPLTLSGYIRPT